VISNCLILVRELHRQQQTLGFGVPPLLGPFSLPPAERLQQCRQRSAASGAAGDLGTTGDLGGSAALFQSDSHWKPVTELLFFVLSCFITIHTVIYNLTVASIHTCVYMCVYICLFHISSFFSELFCSLRDHNRPHRSVSDGIPINQTICSMLGLCRAHVGSMLAFGSKLGRAGPMLGRVGPMLGLHWAMLRPNLAT